MYDVITFGSATQDVFMSSSKFQIVDDEKFDTNKGLCVSLGSKMHMDKVSFAMGGCGTNASVTFARQNLKTAYCGRIGKDFPGGGVKSELAEHGVHLDLLGEMEDFPTAFSVILSVPEVGRSILEKYGACHEFVEKDVPFDKLDTKWFYIASLSAKSHDILKPLMEFAFEKGIKIASNPAGSIKTKDHLEVLRSVLNKIDVLILNQEECAKLADVDFKEEQKIFKKLDKIVKGIAVMTKGPDGVVVSDNEYIYKAGIPKSGLVDRTGAGDAFGSAFVSGLIDKDDIPHAIQLGTANATAVLQEMGAVNGLLKKDDWGSWEKVKVSKEKIS